MKKILNYCSKVSSVEKKIPRPLGMPYAGVDLQGNTDRNSSPGFVF